MINESAKNIIEKDIKKMNFTATRKWLRENIHKYSRTKTTEEIIKKCCGRGLTIKPYVKYLREKFL